MIGCLGFRKPIRKNLFKDRDEGVSRIAFLRHGQTAKAENGVDFDRLLTDEGGEQAKEAGFSFGKSLQPFYPVTLVSPAPRTMETAQIFLQAAGATESTRLLPVQSLYDGTMQPKGSQLFQKLGYAPLRNYLNSDDATDRQVARKLLGVYAHTVVDAITEAIEPSLSRTASTTATATTLSEPTTRKSSDPLHFWSRDLSSGCCAWCGVSGRLR